MKKSLRLRRITVLFLLLTGLWTISSGQVLLNENFDYPNGSLLTSNGWTAHSGAGTQAIDVVVPGLTFSDYPSSGIGGAARVDNNGEDINKTFAAPSSGSVYVAFMLNVVGLPSSDGYFLHLSTNPLNTSYFRAKLFTVGQTSPFNFGISVGANTATIISGGAFTTSTTYLCVIKYEIIDGTNNDAVSLFVIPGSIPSTEPTTPSVGPLTDATMADLNPGSVALRQFNSTQNYLIDGIRVATNWTDAISDIIPPSPIFNPSNAATDIAINTTPTITFDEPVRKTDGSELTNTDLSTLVTLKETDASGSPVAFTGTIDASKKVITVTPSASLKNNQVYYLAVGPVEDAAGNESTLKSITFTTIAATTPTVTVIYPNGGEVLYSGDLATVTWTTTNFDAGENVKIEVWLPESVWYTIEPSTPNDGSQVVTVGPEADYGTAYKIRISGVTNGATDESDNPFTIIATSSTLEDLKTYSLGSKIRYTGEAVITFIRTANRNQKYLQDATGGLLIDDPSGILTTTLAIGDKITGLEGTLGTYTGMFQLVPTVSSVTVVSSGNTVTVPTLTIPEYTANWAQYESMLIRITNLSFPAADGSATFAAQTQYTVTDGTNTLAFFTWKTGEGSPSIVGTVIPGGNLAITGLALRYNTTIELSARSTSDFEILSAVEKTSASDKLKLYPVPSSSVLNISGTPNLKSVDILDAAGKLIRTINTGTEEVVRIPVGTLKSGTYMIRLNTADGTVIKRFVKS